MQSRRDAARIARPKFTAGARDFAPYNVAMLSSPLALLVLKLLFAMLAFATALRIVKAAVPLSSPEGLRGLGGAIAGAAIGAKTGFVLQFPALLLGADPPSAWMVLAGMSGPGAVAGAALGLALAGGARAALFAEALLPAMLTAVLILDLGALFWALTESGFGAPSERWGIDFGDGVTRHPVMLYDAGTMLGLIWAARATRAAGGSAMVRAGMLASACFGCWFLLGFLKPPFGPILLLEAVYPRPVLYAPGLTGEQWLCLAAMLWLGGGAWRALPTRR